ncbi:hypothetical protein M0813_22526 [Anaeramoeba flamelloides]|uniref:Uncharacterized protein n=1 Tax=Anaeramoeba flamelloides TaxID=1746091 RepID=A0ABQ8YCR3_9EUKA|nr:hypothetical protein M0813_22526 [Anaeramoeba flamelloides]
MSETNNIYFSSIFWDFGKYLYTNCAAGSWVNFDKVTNEFTLTFFDSQDHHSQTVLKHYLYLTKCLLIQNAVLLPCESSYQTQEFELSIVWSKVFLSNFTDAQQTSKLANQILKNSYSNNYSQNDAKEPNVRNRAGMRRRLRPRVLKKTSKGPTKSEHEGTKAAKTIGYLGLQLLKILKDQILTREQLVLLTGFSKQRVCNVLSIYQGLSIIKEDYTNNLLQLDIKQANLLPDLGKYLKHIVKIRRIKRKLAKHVMSLTTKYNNHAKILLTKNNKVDINLSNIILLISSKINTISPNPISIDGGETSLDDFKIQYSGNIVLRLGIPELMEENKQIKRSLLKFYSKDLQKMKKTFFTPNEISKKPETLTLPKIDIKGEKKLNDQFLPPLNQLIYPLKNIQKRSANNHHINKKDDNQTIKKSHLNKSQNLKKQNRQVVIIPLGINKQNQKKKYKKKKKKKIRINFKKKRIQQELNFNLQNQNDNKQNLNHIINNNNNNIIKNNKVQVMNNLVNDKQIPNFNTNNPRNHDNNWMINNVVNNNQMNYLNNNINMIGNKNLQLNQNKLKNFDQQQIFNPKTPTSLPWSPTFPQNQQFFYNMDLNLNNKINGISNIYSPSNQNNLIPLNQKLNLLPKMKLSTPNSSSSSILPNTNHTIISPNPRIQNISTSIPLPINQYNGKTSEKEFKQKGNILKNELNQSENQSPLEYSRMTPKIYQQTTPIFGNLSRNYIQPEILNYQQPESNKHLNANTSLSPNIPSPNNQFLMRKPTFNETSSPFLLSPYFGRFQSAMQPISPSGFKNSPSVNPYLSLNVTPTPSGQFQTPFSGLQSLSLTKFPVSSPKEKIEKANTEIYKTSFTKK